MGDIGDMEMVVNMGETHAKEKGEVDVGDGDYIISLFDHRREGLRHVAETICLFLDYISLVSLKRSCWTVHEFLSLGKVESLLLRQQLHADWLTGSPGTSELVLGKSAVVTNVKMLSGGEQLMVSINKNIYLYNVASMEGHLGHSQVGKQSLSSSVSSGLKLKLRLPSTSLNTAISQACREEVAVGDPVRVFTNLEGENLERNIATAMDTMGEVVVGGSNNGVLSVWDRDTAHLLHSKQLFGIITAVSCREEERLIVTSHAGKAFDMGCVSVRRLETGGELVVLWSAYQDVMPVFCLATSPTYLVTLEWLGTMDMVHVGSASVYTRKMGVEGVSFTRRDLSETRAVESRRSVEGLITNLAHHQHRRFTSATIFREHYMALGSDDDDEPHIHNLLVWDLRDLSLLHIFSGHKAPILQIQGEGDRLVTRDKQGNIILWDSVLASDQGYVEGENSLVLMRRLELPNMGQIIDLDMDLRRLCLGMVGGARILDFWRTSPE